MKVNKLTEIAREIYFSSAGRIKWSEIETEYKLSKTELNYVVSLTRYWNRRK